MISTGRNVGVDLPVVTGTAPLIYDVTGQFLASPAEDVLLPTANNARMLRRFRREWASRKRRFVGTAGEPQQADGSVYCEK